MIDVSKYVLSKDEFEIKICETLLKKFENEELKYVIYTDTDSSFVWLYDVIKKILVKEKNMKEHELDKVLPSYDDTEFKKLSLDKNEIETLIIDFAKNLSDYIDNYVLKEFGHRMNISDKHNFFSFKQEFIFSGLYIVAIRNYVARVINKEGKPVDYIDLKNIGAKTDRNPYANKIVKYICEMIVRNKPMKTLKQALYYFISEFYKAILEGRKEVFQPMKLNKNIDEFYTNVENARGALIYMIMTNNRNAFRAGTKGYKIKIKGFKKEEIDNYKEKINELFSTLKTKFKIKEPRHYINVICVPEEEPIPKWVIVDSIKQLESTLLSFLRAVLAQTPLIDYIDKIVDKVLDEVH